MKAHAIVIAFHPDHTRLSNMAVELQSAGLSVIVVDNSEPSAALELEEYAEVISLGHNSGIAAAQNVGIRRALDDGSQVMLFLDQDSRVQADKLAILLAELKAQDPKIVAPTFFDERKGFEYPAIRVNRWGWRRKIVPSRHGRVVTVDIVISSGTAVNRTAIERIGLMDENLFIDYVDTEWCLRARHLGVPIQVLPAAQMMHSIGDNSLNLRIARVPVHSPWRRYYRVRNALFLIRMPHVPKWLAIREIIFAFLHQGILIAHGPNRRAYGRYFIKALADGVRGKKGKLS